MGNLRISADISDASCDWGTSYTYSYWLSPVKVKLIVRSHFDAAHRLDKYEGECANPHGHTWHVEVVVPIYVQPDAGDYYSTVTTDFKIVKAKLKELLPDHKYLNEFLDFNPTAENIAIWLKAKLRAAGVFPEIVRVWESDDCGVEV